MVIPDDNITFENVFYRLQGKHLVNLDLNEECEFVAKHFFEINQNKLNELPACLIEIILQSKYLIINDENTLFDFLSQYVPYHSGSSFLFGCIYCDYLDIDRKKSFSNIIKHFQIYDAVWDKVYRHVIFPWNEPSICHQQKNPSFSNKDQLFGEMDNLHNTIQLKDSEIIQLQDVINQKNSEIERLSQDLTQLNHTIQQKESENKQLNKKVNNLSNNILQKDTEKEKLNQEVHSLQKSIQQKDSEKDNFIKEINSLQKSIQQKDSEKDNLIKEINSLRNSIQQKDSEKDNLIKEINSLRNSIQHKCSENSRLDKEINDLKKTLQQKESDYILIQNDNIKLNEIIALQPPFMNDVIYFTQFTGNKDYYFSGILSAIPNSNVDITASSVYDRFINSDPYNVLEENDNNWISSNDKNSWIQFDFYPNKISLSSYSLRTYRGPKSWKLEGSNDLIKFILIDERNNLKDFQNEAFVNQHYFINGSRDEFRFIRITQGNEGSWDSSWGSSHIFSLTRVEFYGCLLKGKPNWR